MSLFAPQNSSHHVIIAHIIPNTPGQIFDLHDFTLSLYLSLSLSQTHSNTTIIQCAHLHMSSHETSLHRHGKKIGVFIGHICFCNFEDIGDQILTIRNETKFLSK